MIEVENLKGGYNGVEVLKGVDLKVEEEEILAVMGQSGCGKSTFLRYLMGLEKPTGGSVKINNIDPSSAKGERYREFCRSVGVLFQNGALFTSMTVGDNVAFPLRQHTALDYSVIDIMVDMKLDQVELRGVKSLMPSELSGGMRRRAALARALVMDPRLVLLDEPTTGLDPIISAGIDELVLHIREAYRATMVIVAHDIESCMNVADKIAIFREGKVLEVGTTDQIRASENLFVQQFFNRQPERKEDHSSLFL